MPDRAFIQLPGEDHIRKMGSFQMGVKAEAAQTGGVLTVLEADEPANFGPPLHIHDDSAEAFCVLDGEYINLVEEAEYRCHAGSFIYIPVGNCHGFHLGERLSKKLVIFLPAAMVGYFDELANVEVAGVVLDVGELTTIAVRYAMRVLGPVREGYM